MQNSEILKKVKELREITGVGFKDCKLAIDECNGDIDLSIDYLRKKGISKAAVQYRDGFERGLAHNLISQHRFSEADSILQKSYKGVSHKRASQLMLFDAAMELGKYKEAYGLLNALKDMSDINYLIRLSKWSDYKGDLDSAIKYMEMARDMAESMDNVPLKIWTYSNLGDYYGHAGRVADAYQYYLKTLELQPDNAYVKKGIAWIAYAAEGNASEAHRILDTLMQNHRIPDYHLLKAELYHFQGDKENAEKEEAAFIKSVKEGDYGAMYNTYLIELYVDTNPTKALEIAKQEVGNRATPETYQLLALAQLKNGMKQEALATIQNHVVGKTFEPAAQFTTALIYKANGMDKEVKELKKELLTASFEVGPMKTQEIKSL